MVGGLGDVGGLGVLVEDLEGGGLHLYHGGRRAGGGTD